VVYSGENYWGDTTPTYLAAPLLTDAPLGPRNFPAPANYSVSLPSCYRQLEHLIVSRSAQVRVTEAFAPAALKHTIPRMLWVATTRPQVITPHFSCHNGDVNSSAGPLLVTSNVAWTPISAFPPTCQRPALHKMRPT
jgi:hypothetical protein